MYRNGASAVARETFKTICEDGEGSVGSEGSEVPEASGAQEGSGSIDGSGQSNSAAEPILDPLYGCDTSQAFNLKDFR